MQSGLRLDVSALLLGQLAASGAGIVSTIVLARHLGPARQGDFAVYLSAFAIVSIAGGFGLGTFNRSYAKPLASSLGLLIGNSVLTAFGSGCVSLIAGLALARALDAEPIALALAFGFVGIVAELARALLHGLGHVRLFTAVRIATYVGWLTLVGVIVALDIRDLVLLATIWAFVQLVGAVFMLVVLRRKAGNLAIDVSLLGRAWRFAGQAWIAYVLGIFNYRIDLLLVYVLIGSTAAGVYAIAVLVAEVGVYLPAAIGTALVPRFASASSRDARKFLDRGIRHAFLLGLLSSGAALLGAIFLLVSVFGVQYSGAITLIPILAIGVIGHGPLHVINSYFEAAARKPSLNAALAGLSLCVEVALIVLFVTPLGVVGVALGSSLGYLAASVFAFWLIRTRVRRER